MAFKATGVLPKDALDKVRYQAGATKRYLQSRRVAFVAPNTTAPADQVLDIMTHVHESLAVMTTHAAVPGLAQYARDQVNDQNYDIVAEYQTMKATLDALRDGIVTLFPADGSGWLLYEKANANGSITTRTFTVAQLAGVVSLIDAAIATID